MLHENATTQGRLHHELLVAGYGGQGVIKLGQMLAQAALLEGHEVVLTPAYGAEMRGGPSFCSLTISSDPIGSPVVGDVDTAIIMDRPSLPKYQGLVREHGILLLNSSVVDVTKARADVPCYAVDALRVAEEIGETLIANMVMLGAFLHLTGLVSTQSVISVLHDTLPERRRHLIPLNQRALEMGGEALTKVAVPVG